MNQPAPDAVGTQFLHHSRGQLEQCLKKIEHCLGQLDEEQLWWRPCPPHNSVANLLLHLAGNLRQWIIAGIGGAADVRERQQEFAERGPLSKDELHEHLAQTVGEACDVLERLPPEYLLKPRRIQGFDETALSAIYGTVCHFAGHTQEIISFTRAQRGNDYQFLWQPQTPEQGAP